MELPEPVCYVWSEYVLRSLPSELSYMLSNPRVRTATARTRCAVEVTKRVLNRCEPPSKWVRYSIIRITGPDDQAISQCNRLLERVLPFYDKRREYGKRAPITLYSKCAIAKGDFASLPSKWNDLLSVSQPSRRSRKSENNKRHPGESQGLINKFIPDSMLPDKVLERTAIGMRSAANDTVSSKRTSMPSSGKLAAHSLRMDDTHLVETSKNLAHQYVSASPKLLLTDESPEETNVDLLSVQAGSVSLPLPTNADHTVTIQTDQHQTRVSISSKISSDSSKGAYILNTLTDADSQLRHSIDNPNLVDGQLVEFGSISPRFSNDIPPGTEFVSTPERPRSQSAVNSIATSPPVPTELCDSEPVCMFSEPAACVAIRPFNSSTHSTSKEEENFPAKLIKGHASPIQVATTEKTTSAIPHLRSSGSALGDLGNDFSDHDHVSKSGSFQAKMNAMLTVTGSAFVEPVGKIPAAGGQPLSEVTVYRLSDVVFSTQMSVTRSGTPSSHTLSSIPPSPIKLNEFGSGKFISTVNPLNGADNLEQQHLRPTSAHDTATCSGPDSPISVSPISDPIKIDLQRQTDVKVLYQSRPNTPASNPLDVTPQNKDTVTNEPPNVNYVPDTSAGAILDHKNLVINTESHIDQSYRELAASTSPDAVRQSRPNSVTSITTNYEFCIDRETGKIGVTIELSGTPLLISQPEAQTSPANPPCSMEWNLKLQRNAIFGPVGTMTADADAAAVSSIPTADQHSIGTLNIDLPNNTTK